MAPTAVTLSVPSCVNKGEVVTISATYPQVTQLRGTAILRQPLIGPPYQAEAKINIRQAGLVNTGSVYNFYIDEFFQIGGTAVVVVSIQGAGAAFATFQIPCP